MRNFTAGWLALADHLIDRLAEGANKALADDRIWLGLIVVIGIMALLAFVTQSYAL